MIVYPEKADMIILVHAPRDGRISPGLLAVLQGHHLLGTTSENEFLMCVARDQPAGIVVLEPGESDLRWSTIPILRLDPDFWTTVDYRRLEEFLQSLMYPHWEQSPPSRQYILHDPAYTPYRPSYDHQRALTPAHKASVSEEYNKLRSQLYISTDTMLWAIKYFHSANRSWKYFRQETSYRILHGSYKAVRLREQIGRWLSVLAHFIPGVELGCLPTPQENPSHLLYLHFETHPRILYALAAVKSFHPNAAALSQLDQAVKYVFKGESESELMDVSLKLMGVCDLMRDVAAAQLSHMKQLNDEHSVWNSGSILSPKLRWQERTFLDFWNLKNMKRLDREGARGAVRTLRRDGLGRLHAPKFMPYSEFLLTLRADERA